MKYKEYYALQHTEYKFLVRTNYYRLKHDLPLIEVPKIDTEYWKKWKAKLKLELIET